MGLTYFDTALRSNAVGAVRPIVLGAFQMLLEVVLTKVLQDFKTPYLSIGRD